MYSAVQAKLEAIVQKKFQIKSELIQLIHVRLSILRGKTVILPIGGP